MQRMEREELFSHWYINKVKETLGENSTQYNEFLEALITFGKQKKNPAVVGSFLLYTTQLITKILIYFGTYLLLHILNQDFTSLIT